ncbi:helix-turn-helix domain-containing protein [Peribacillus deserti]|uniref:helix-turn-helix domain-containing protein n=1 Tax=Peribacillus deserti TaxID=673318 RepID=UPI001159A021|nr:helix-turn-helix domain-containing protein [Peribacillus deserti]
MGKRLGWDEDIHEIFNVDDDQVLTVDMISDMTKMSVETVRRWCRSGKLSSYQFGGKYIVVGTDFKHFMRASRRAMGYGIQSEI